MSLFDDLPDDLKKDARAMPMPPEQLLLSLGSFAAGAFHGFITAQGKDVPLEGRAMLVGIPLTLETIAGGYGFGFGGRICRAVIERLQKEGRPIGYEEGTFMGAGAAYGCIFGTLTQAIGFGAGYVWGKLF
ncbi:hypothetical protein HY493_03070 [Candidatus Woesearchaeota archaeon]|nr:hypothetical protein [Candidatus Woesearchaeota archaeon]